MKLKDVMRVMDIEDELVEANRIYAETGENGLPESKYNALMKELQDIQPDHKLLQSIQEVKVVSNGKVKHDRLMLSLEKVYDIEGLKKWMKKVSRTVAERFIITLKFDGIAARFVDGVLGTRGDGEFGENISHRIKFVNFYKDGNYDGELLITKKHFKEIVERNLLKRGDGSSYKNSRNAVSGIVGSDYDIVWWMSWKPLDFIPYDWHAVECTIKNVDEVLTFFDNFKEIYPTDGLVIKLMDEEYGNSLGHTSHHYRHSIALKESETETVKTILKDVQFQMAKQHIGMVGIVEPVEIGGVTVSKVSLHNMDIVKSKNLKIGDSIILKRAGEVIPHIVESLGGGTKEIECKFCPSCNSPVKLDGQFWKCTGSSCSDMSVNKIVAGAKILGFKGIAKSTIGKLYESRVIEDIAGLFNVSANSLDTAGFPIGSKSSINILNEVSRVRNSKIKSEQVLAALSIDGFGVSIFKTMLKKYNIEELVQKIVMCNTSDLLEIDGMSNIRVNQLIDGFDNELYETLVISLNMDVNETINEKEVDVKSKGTICFTGKMPDKRAVLEDHARMNGYEPVSSVSKDLDILVVEDPTLNSTKLQKATKLGIKIISRQEFYEMTDSFSS